MAPETLAENIGIDVEAERPRLVLASALAVIPFLCSLLLATAHIEWPLDDFAEYWAAGRLNAAGQNPYDPAAVLHEQRQIGWQQPRPVMMYNPPWTLALAMPVSAIEFQLARSIWLPVQMLITLWCGSRLWRLYGGARRYGTRVCCLALLWSPTLFALRMGQLSPLILLGLVGFLWSLSWRRDVIAGVFFSLTAVKPQLVALVWVPFLPWVIHHRRWNVLAGVATCIAGASLVALSANPSVFVQFERLIRSSPPTLEFESPNISTVLQLAAGNVGSWPQFVPTCLGAIAVGAVWYQRRAAWEWSRELPGLVLISCLLTSYGGWAFDLVILLVPIVATAAILTSHDRKSWAALGAGAFAVISFGAFAMHVAHVPQFAFLWMTPAVAIFSYGLSRCPDGAARPS